MYQLADQNQFLIKYDRDSTMSSETWKAALLASGTIIEACDKIMSN
jgi:acetoin utilization deacetylase AcuC-like enzyme